MAFCESQKEIRQSIFLAALPSLFFLTATPVQAGGGAAPGGDVPGALLLILTLSAAVALCGGGLVRSIQKTARRSVYAPRLRDNPE